MTHAWQRIARSLGWDCNPLRRPVDRAAAVSISVVLLIGLLGAPVVGVVAGRIADAVGIREQQAERSWQQEPVTLTESADQVPPSDISWGAAWVRAAWTAPDGQHRTGLVATELNARVGQRITETMTPSGDLTPERLTAADVRDQVAFVVISALMALGLVLGLAAGVLELVFNRRRIAGWQRAWDAVGPHWSRQR
jgi:hypothetical protein